MSGEASSSGSGGGGAKQVRMAEAQVDQVVKVGMHLFKELGERTSRMEGQLEAYREAMVAIAQSKGVELPSFLTEQSGSLGQVGSGAEVRSWLKDTLNIQEATVEAGGSGSRSRGRATKGKGRSKSTRAKRAKSDRMDEGWWKVHHTGMLQGTCFAVEWRESVLLSLEDFVRQLFLLMGGDISFVVGCEIRESRADYSLVVRTTKRVRWKSWRKMLMFAHGVGAEQEGLFMRVRVPTTGTDQGINSFIGQMKRRCEAYEETSKYKEEDLVRVRKMDFKRPGRKSKIDVR